MLDFKVVSAAMSYPIHLRMMRDRDVNVLDDVPLFRLPPHVSEPLANYERDVIRRLVPVKLVVPPSGIFHERVDVLADKRVLLVARVTNQRALMGAEPFE